MISRPLLRLLFEGATLSQVQLGGDNSDHVIKTLSEWQRASVTGRMLFTDIVAKQTSKTIATLADEELKACFFSSEAEVTRALLVWSLSLLPGRSPFATAAWMCQSL